MSSDPGVERSPRGGHSNPLQYSCLENPILVGYSPWGRERFGHDLATKQQQQNGVSASAHHEGLGVFVPQEHLRSWFYIYTSWFSPLLISSFLVP